MFGKCSMCDESATCLETEAVEVAASDQIVSVNGVLPDGSKVPVQRMAKVRSYVPGAMKPYCDAHRPKEVKA